MYPHFLIKVKQVQVFFLGTLLKRYSCFISPNFMLGSSYRIYTAQI